LLSQNNRIYVFGTVISPSSGADIWLGRTNASGTAWDWNLAKSGAGDSADSSLDFVVDVSGNAYVLGQLDNGLPGSGRDIWLGKCITGTYWNWTVTKSGFGSNTDTPHSFVLNTSSGAAFVLGQVANTGANFDIWLGRPNPGLEQLGMKHKQKRHG